MMQMQYHLFSCEGGFDLPHRLFRLALRRQSSDIDVQSGIVAHVLLWRSVASPRPNSPVWSGTKNGSAFK